MLVLSFRDMSRHAYGVTVGGLFDLGAVNAATVWSPPKWPKPASGSPNPLQGKHVCFLVHGFNVPVDHGYMGYGAFGEELQGGGALTTLNPAIDYHVPGVDLVAPVLWVGDWYIPVVNYPFLLGDIRLTGRYFADFITSSAAQMARVSFITHSMGARVVLEAVQAAVKKARTMGTRLPVFDTAIFTASATSDEVLDDPAYADAVAAMQRFVILSSRGDHTLSGAFPVGNWVEQLLWAHDPGADAALGRYGPRLKRGSKALGKTDWYDVTQSPSPPNRAQDHGDYIPAPWISSPYPNGWTLKHRAIGAIAQAVLEGQPPPWPPAKPVTPRP